MKARVLQDLEVAKLDNLQEDLQSKPQGWLLIITQAEEQHQHTSLTKSPVVRNPAKTCGAKRLADPAQDGNEDPFPCG